MVHPKQTIQIKRGKKANIPTLKSGELGFAEDTKELYIGQDNLENLKLFSETAAEEKPCPYIACEFYSSGDSSLTAPALDDRGNEIPILSEITYSNVPNYKDYFVKTTAPKLPAPALGLKKSGLYYISFDSLININSVPECELVSARLIAITKYEPYGYRYYDLSDLVNLEGKRGEVRLKDTRLTYLTLEGPLFEPMKVVLTYSFSGPMNSNPTKVLADIKELNLEIHLMKDIVDNKNLVVL